jgi:hypothetical protein
MADAFGRALLDHHRGERDDPLRQRDGEFVRTHPIEDFYFGAFGASPAAEWVESQVSGPLLDMGAGAGRDALYFQGCFETVAIEVSEALVTLLSERGVRDARHGDMFALRESFGADRFRSALARGTQVGLAKSPRGLRAFLDDLDHVTTSDATVVLDCYDPTYEDAPEMLGFRADQTPGLAFRVFHFEYGDVVGETLLFRLFSPDRLREAAGATGWAVAEIKRPHDAYHYLAALRKA